jgi:DedD protein
MAKAISDEELQLRKRARRRLIGAIALVILAVLLLPMLLDQEPRPVTQNISVTIPSQSSGPFVSKIVPVTPAGKAEGKAKAAPPPVAAAEPPPAPPAPEAQPKPEPVPPLVKAPRPEAVPPAPPQEAVVEAKPAPTPKAEAKPKAEPKTEAKAEPKTKPKADAKADAAAGGFAVQVAALADPDKVKELQARITEGGLKSYTEPVATAKGPVTRVRAGPFPTRAAAEEARDKLKSLGLPGTVIAR